MINNRLQAYLDTFEKDRLERNQIRDWSYNGVSVRLFPNVFPSDSPYSLTTTSMLDALEHDSQDLSHLGTALDIGTGNGAIAVYLAGLMHHTQVIAVDKDLEALTAVRWNARHKHLSNVTVVASDLFSSFDRDLGVDLVVVSLPFTNELLGEGLVERFWLEARRHLRPGTHVYFSWAEWVSFPRLERIASREGFFVIRSYDYSIARVSYKWRVYVFGL